MCWHTFKINKSKIIGFAGHAAGLTVTCDTVHREWGCEGVREEVGYRDASAILKRGQCLTVQVVSESLASILLNCSSLLRLDLDGVNVLAPSLVAALEIVLPEREVTMTIQANQDRLT